jgi:glycosyltransferase involved in cell wall biosynthesis
MVNEPDAGGGRAIPSVALFCATFLKPEMLHIHRQVTGLKNFRPVVIAQKREGNWWVNRLEVIPRSSWRFLARMREKMAGYPWQISQDEAGKMLRVLERENCRLLHVFFGNAAVHLLPLLKRSPVPVVVSFHGSDVAGTMSSSAFAGALAEMFGLAAVVPCRSERLMQRVAELGCPREKLRLMRTVLPDIPFVQRQSPSDASWRVVQAARLVAKKGIATALRAFKVFAAKYPRSSFAIAGEGPMVGELRGLALELGIGEKVEFTGFLDQEALQELFFASHIFLHPSETVGGDAEGVPNAMLEAMAGGLPVVATRHGGIPEVITDGENGLLCEEKNPPQVAHALLHLAGDSDFYRTLSKKASLSVREQFSGERQIAAIETLYHEAISFRSGEIPVR